MRRKGKQQSEDRSIQFKGGPTKAQLQHPVLKQLYVQLKMLESWQERSEYRIRLPEGMSHDSE